MGKQVIPRRTFLRSLSASFALIGISQSSDLEKNFAEIRANLLEIINEERAVAKVSPVAIDELAQQVATKHAVDMVTGEFASHWGRDGLKPYHRYSFAGGTDATQENVSAADNTWSTKLPDLKQDTAYMHVRLYQEKPPNDGHRRAILASQNTHVGFGLAIAGLRLRLVELFVARHVDVKPLSRVAKPGARIVLKGKMLRPEYLFNSVEVFYEPLPKPADLKWLQEPRSYSLPDESRILPPKLPRPFVYKDGKKGVVEVALDGSFTAPVTLFKNEPGIYTIVTWIRRELADPPFPATHVCIRAE